MKNTKFAVIGNGFIAQKHIESIKEIGGDIVSICDIDETKEIPGIPFYTDYKEAIKDCDIVSICTPNDTHLSISLEAARQNKIILSEKPIIMDLNYLTIAKLIPNLFGTFQLRKLPELSIIRKASKIAKNVNLKVEMKRSKSYHNSWKGDDKRTGGLLINIGMHYFDLIGHLFGYDDFKVKEFNNLGTGAFGIIEYPDVKVNWSIELTDEKEIYERYIEIDGIKFDLVQKENLHTKIYEDLLWNHGVTIDEEEKILKMINKLCL